jgi:hypothetical protein
LAEDWLSGVETLLRVAIKIASQIGRADEPETTRRMWRK